MAELQEAINPEVQLPSNNVIVFDGGATRFFLVDWTSLRKMSLEEALLNANRPTFDSNGATWLRCKSIEGQKLGGNDECVKADSMGIAS